MNYFKTGVLLIALTLLLVWIGGTFAGESGAIFAFAMALVMNFGAYWFSDKIVLGMYRAKQISSDAYPEIFSIVGGIARQAELPMPKVYIMESGAPNAFATGRNPKHGALCLTTGIVSLLDREELKGVIAHELAHIKNRDTLIMTVTATIAGAIMLLANMLRWGAMFGGYGRNSRERGGNAIALLGIVIVAPIAATLIQLAISRTREYSADKRGAQFAHNPRGLAGALSKLEQASKFGRLNASPQTAHMFIVNPLSGDFFASLFSTHPPIKERIRRLLEAA